MIAVAYIYKVKDQISRYYSTPDIGVRCWAMNKGDCFRLDYPLPVTHEFYKNIELAETCDHAIFVPAQVARFILGLP